MLWPETTFVLNSYIDENTVYVHEDENESEISPGAITLFFRF